MKISVNPNRPPVLDNLGSFPALVQSVNGLTVLLFLDPNKALVLQTPSESRWDVGQITTEVARFWKKGEYIPFYGSVTFEATP